ncbi:Uncharacterized ACR, COG1399 [Cutibacterium granulosum]|uniref:Metal-binding protein n=4 Tax=Cutibacterium granulosum TaxID=33011 RepID=U1EUR6_9ACTN|nr:DUF177 domain-containing protein [Cutibacterium granulosum]ERF55457.1 Metal-binding protein [Cutibacterium granulosum DSM 20700]ERF63643.1 Metal-binding protein [Cutibacterium granulosum TM11]KAG9059475.1 DUF177 domain-containing protein [Cutibacterium granulosum DSM 20700]MDU3768427.1 DUF177 domain-containing protein [Cutibacterium granulosum]SNV37698.1 Uncharacterized ACR, COG1399 [Cutibacterium granulosum]
MNTNHRRPDGDNALLMDVSGLRRQAGQMIAVHRPFPAPAELGVDMIRVPEGSSIDVDLRMESVVEGILVTGTASTTLVGECSRCLDRIEDPRTFDLQELYFYPDREAEEDSLWVQDDDTIDLDPVLREAIVLNLPLNPLCDPDCLGLCPECGAHLNDDPDHDHGDQIDPRWAELAKFDPMES